MRGVVQHLFSSREWVSERERKELISACHSDTWIWNTIKVERTEIRRPWKCSARQNNWSLGLPCVNRFMLQWTLIVEQGRLFSDHHLRLQAWDRSIRFSGTSQHWSYYSLHRGIKCGNQPESTSITALFFLWASYVNPRDSSRSSSSRRRYAVPFVILLRKNACQNDRISHFDRVHCSH